MRGVHDGVGLKKLVSLGLLRDENLSVRAPCGLSHVAKTSCESHGGVTPTSQTVPILKTFA
jgi:hypothetical protein